MRVVDLYGLPAQQDPKKARIAGLLEVSTNCTCGACIPQPCFAERHTFIKGLKRRHGLRISPNRINNKQRALDFCIYCTTWFKLVRLRSTRTCRSPQMKLGTRHMGRTSRTHGLVVPALHFVIAVGIYRCPEVLPLVKALANTILAHSLKEKIGPPQP